MDENGAEIKIYLHSRIRVKFTSICTILLWISIQLIEKAANSQSTSYARIRYIPIFYFPIQRKTSAFFYRWASLHMHLVLILSIWCRHSLGSNNASSRELFSLTDLTHTLDTTHTYARHKSSLLLVLFAFFALVLLYVSMRWIGVVFVQTLLPFCQRIDENKIKTTSTNKKKNVSTQNLGETKYESAKKDSIFRFAVREIERECVLRVYWFAHRTPNEFWSWASERLLARSLTVSSMCVYAILSPEKRFLNCSPSSLSSSIPVCTCEMMLVSKNNTSGVTSFGVGIAFYSELQATPFT